MIVKKIKLYNGLTIEGTEAQIAQVQKLLGFAPSDVGLHFSQTKNMWVWIETMPLQHIRHVLQKIILDNLKDLNKLSDDEFLALARMFPETEKYCEVYKQKLNA